jgi:inner membrane protein
MVKLMEPVTHILTGACLARACGFNKRARYATLAMAIAAEIPDADFVYTAHGSLAYFQHHRGWTHSLLWLPLEAAITLGIVWLWHRLRTRKETSTKPGDPPLRWLYLFGICLIALVSHILLDWTNNYGVRPFAPFNPRWYQGEFIFIFEPLIFLALVLALILPPLFTLTDSEVGAKRTRFRGQGFAITALLFVLALWGYRYGQHEKAVAIAQQQLYSAGDNKDAQVLRVGINPYPATPFQWYAVVETPNFYQTGIVNTRLGTMEFTPQDLFWKPAVTPATEAADGSQLGRVYLDWARYPLVEDLGVIANNDDPDLNGLHAVRFRDLRFMFNNFAYNGRDHNPLSGTAYVDAQNRIVRMEMNNNAKK